MQNNLKKCICDIKISDVNKYYADAIDDFNPLTDGTWVRINLGIQHNGEYVLWTTGDKARYYPKYCPECGRRLNAK